MFERSILLINLDFSFLFSENYQNKKLLVFIPVAQGDLVSWEQEEWSDFGDVAIEAIDYQKLCEVKFEDGLVAVPEPVTFHEAAFICDFLSGKVYSVDNEVHDSGDLYSVLKSKLNLKVS